jgi:O-Antigen ligase
MIVRYRDFISIMIVASYCVFNYGFQVIKLPPGRFGIPIGELLILIFVFICNHKHTLKHFLTTSLLFPISSLFIVCVIHLFSDLKSYGFWALRDANHVIETFYIYIGFSLSLQSIKFIFKHYNKFYIIGVFYSFLYPFREFITVYLPKIATSAGHQTTILNFITAPFFLLGRSFLLIADRGSLNLKNILLSGFILSYTVVLFQARTIYLQILIIGIITSALMKYFSVRAVFLLFCFIIFLSIIQMFNFNLNTRIGLDLNFTNLKLHLLSMFGIASKGLENAAHGVSQRLDWWQNIILINFKNFEYFLIGRGYGFPLIDFTSSDSIIVREPHNSIISIFGRLGIIGIFLFSFLHIYGIAKWYKTYTIFKSDNNRKVTTFLYLILTWWICTWVYSIGEDAFEKPFLAIPFYFFYGLVFKIHYLRKKYGIRF